MSDNNTPEVPMEQNLERIHTDVETATAAMAEMAMLNKGVDQKLNVIGRNATQQNKQLSTIVEGLEAHRRADDERVEKHNETVARLQASVRDTNESVESVLSDVTQRTAATQPAVDAIQASLVNTASTQEEQHAKTNADLQSYGERLESLSDGVTRIETLLSDDTDTKALAEILEVSNSVLSTLQTREATANAHHESVDAVLSNLSAMFETVNARVDSYEEKLEHTDKLVAGIKDAVALIDAKIDERPAELTVTEDLDMTVESMFGDFSEQTPDSQENETPETETVESETASEVVVEPTHQSKPRKKKGFFGRKAR